MKAFMICACFLLFTQVININAQDTKPECETNEDCMANGQCIDNVCQCSDGFVEVKKWLKKVCLPYATVDNAFACEADEQCSLIQDESNPEGASATCSLFGRTCGCKDSSWYPFQTEEHSYPFCVRGFGSTCDNDEQCQRSITDAVCEEKKCACPADFVTLEDEHMCLPYATEEENHCVVDEQCGNMYDKFAPSLFHRHPKCDNNTESCVCHMDNFAIYNNTCVRGVGARCGFLRKCGVEHSKCSLLSLSCTCNFGYKVNEETHTCERFWSAGEDSDAKPECETDEDCMENGQCFENMCQCQEGFVETKHWLKTVCVPFSTPETGFECNYDEQCGLIEDDSNPRGEPATCRPWKNTCRCNDDSLYPDQDVQTNKLFCARGFDSTCETDAQCQRNIPDSVCLEKKCACSDDFFRLDDEQMCLPYATEEQNVCIIDEQCEKMEDVKGKWFHKHPFCDNNTSSCVCHEENWVLNNGTCVRGLGARCGVMRDCGIEHSKCGLIPRRCVCEKGYKPNEETNTCEEIEEVRSVNAKPTRKVLYSRA